MPISNETTKNTYVLNESTTVFPYEFKIFADTDISVIRTDTTDNSEVTLTLTTDYTVSDVGEDAGGNVTYADATSYDSDYKLTLLSNVTYTQPTDFEENDDSRAQTMDNTVDRIVMQTKQLNEKLDRAVLRDVTQTSTIQIPAASEGKALKWKSGELVNSTYDPDEQVEDAEAFADAAEVSATDAQTAQTAAELAKTNAETAETNAAQSASDASDSADDAEAAAASVPTYVRDTFVDGDLTAGVLTITHNLGLSAPYALNLLVYDNNNNMILPDEITGATNTIELDLSSYGTLIGTYGYAYLAG